MLEFQVEFLKTLEDGTRLVPDLEKLERVEEFKVCFSSIPLSIVSFRVSGLCIEISLLLLWYLVFFGHIYWACVIIIWQCITQSQIYPTQTMIPEAFLSKSLSPYRKSSFLWVARSCITLTASRSTALSVPATLKCPKCWSKVRKSQLKHDLAEFWDFYRALRLGVRKSHVIGSGASVV